MKAKKLLEKIERLIDKNEYNTIKLDGVSCSRSDLEALAMMLKHFLTYGDFGNFMLLGNVKEVLEKNNLIRR